MSQYIAAEPGWQWLTSDERHKRQANVRKWLDSNAEDADPVQLVKDLEDLAADALVKSYHRLCYEQQQGQGVRDQNDIAELADSDASIFCDELRDLISRDKSILREVIVKVGDWVRESQEKGRQF